MAHVTEAACLLQSGALYGRRLGLRPGAGDEVFAGFKPGAFSLYFGDEPYFHFDLEGRWQRALVEGIHYLKSLDNTVQAIDRVREGTSLVLHRRTLGPAEARALDERIRTTATGLRDAFLTGKLATLPPPAASRPIDRDDLVDMLGRIGGWDVAAWSDHAALHDATYGPMPFLPPDCQHAVVVQATSDPSGRVGFGRADQPRRDELAAADFPGHLARVNQLLRGRISQCRSVFLAGPGALRRPMGDVLATFDAILSAFRVDPSAPRPRAADFDDRNHTLDGIHTFLDRFEAPLPDRDGWRELRTRHLVRVHLGIESGDPEIRARFGRTWANAELRDLVADLKAAGLGVGVIVLTGLEGDAHVEATAALLESLTLGAGDLVSLVDAAQFGGEAGEGLRDESGRFEQAAALKSSLATVRSARGFKVANYSLEKQAGLSV